MFYVTNRTGPTILSRMLCHVDNCFYRGTRHNEETGHIRVAESLIAKFILNADETEGMRFEIPLAHNGRANTVKGGFGL